MTSDVAQDKTDISRAGFQTRAAEPALLRLAPFLLALLVLASALRGVSADNIIDTDAARHAMNGVFVHDLLGSGQIKHPIEYGKEFYSHLPALSMPYHPPMFPAIESMFFLVFGINVMAARLAVGICAGICAFLLYRMVLSTHRSHALALCVTLTFFSFRTSRWMAADTMLEFPSMAFALGALYCLRDMDRGYRLGRGVLFAILAGAAVWTKQQTVFLGMVPFLMVLFTWKWKLLLQKTIWISSVLFGAQVVALSLLSVPFKGTGVNQASTRWIVPIFVHNLGYYVMVLRERMGSLGLLLFGILFFATVWRYRKVKAPEWRTNSALALYLAWFVAAFLLLLLIGPYEARYLFYAYPALIVLVCVSGLRALGWLVPSRLVWYAPAVTGVVSFVVGLLAPIPYLSGPSQAAAAVLTESRQRILYCGDTDGSFMFGVRSRDPRLQNIVIPGDKLPTSVFAPAEFEKFANRYGINQIVLENTRKPRPWDALYKNPIATMELNAEIPLQSSNPRWNGGLRIFRFTNPSSNPENTLKIAVPRVGADFEAKF